MIRVAVEQAGHGLEGLAARIHAGVAHLVGERQVKPVQDGGNIGDHGVEHHEQQSVARRAQVGTDRSSDARGGIDARIFQAAEQGEVGHFIEAQQPQAAVAEIAVLHQRGKNRSDQRNAFLRTHVLQQGKMLALGFGQHGEHARFRPVGTPCLQHLAQGVFGDIFQIMHASGRHGDLLML